MLYYHCCLFGARWYIKNMNPLCHAMLSRSLLRTFHFYFIFLLFQTVFQMKNSYLMNLLSFLFRWCFSVIVSIIYICFDSFLCLWKSDVQINFFKQGFQYIILKHQSCWGFQATRCNSDQSAYCIYLSRQGKDIVLD